MTLASAMVYRIARREILRYLPIADLASFIRVERDCVKEVIAELYHTMCYVRVLCLMPDTTPRSRDYIAAVRVIDARHPSVQPAWLRKTSPPSSFDSRLFRDDSSSPWSYTEAEFTSTVLPMKQKCPGLILIRLGNGSAGWIPSWEVRFNPLSGVRHILEYTGRIELVKDIENYASAGSKDRLRYARTLTPPNNYTIHARFNFVVQPDPWVSNGRHWHQTSSGYPIEENWMWGEDPAYETYDVDVGYDAYCEYEHPDDGVEDPAVLKHMIEQVRKVADYSHLHQHVDFGNLPLTLTDLTNLYLRQTASGYSDGLRTIAAQRIQPWNIHDFQTLARVASTFLTSLILAPLEREEVTGSALLHFEELPSIIKTVRNTLVNLRVLAIGLGGIENAEVVCGEMLDEGGLGDMGTVRKLTIAVPECDYPTPIFNTLRILTRLCTSTAEVKVQLFVEDPRCCSYGRIKYQHLPESQTRFLQYLRSQSLQRKRHLATVDFATLGMTRLEQVGLLEYQANGRVLHLQHSRRGGERV